MWDRKRRDEMNIPEYADDIDHTLFSAANRLERLAERTGDAQLLDASRIVGEQRSKVRRYMTETMRGLTPA